MYSISNFSSLLELMAGLNLILVLFEVLPILRDEQRKLEANCKDSWQDQLLIFVQTVSVDLLLLLLSGVGSITSIALLIWSGFDPKAEIQWWVMAGLIVLSFLIVPCLAVFVLFVFKLQRKISE